MRLVERHVIKRADRRFKPIDRAAFAAKHLYNKALYATRQAFFADGSLPTYPTIWRFAQIQGEVVARVKIRMGTVVETEIKSGDSRLRDSTIANLKTWRFGDRVSTSITVTYTYEISGESTDGLTNPKVEVLPDLDVKITARPIKPSY